MDNLSKGLLGTTVGIGSLAIMKDSTKMLNKPTTKNMIKGTTKIIAGSVLLGAMSDAIK